jgi:NAD(P)-dependent dehydrogenase (short-subunit alcohol dehydrogenase family)
LLQDGWKVVIADIDPATTERVAQELGCVPLTLDITDPAAIQNAARWVEDKVGPCGALAAVAGIIDNPRRPEDFGAEDWDRTFDINARGTYLTCRAFAAHMTKRKSGAIVTIGSLAAIGSAPLMGYGPSKAAVIKMTENLAVFWGREGIRVNCICPGPVRTPTIEASYRRGERDPAVMERMTALGRLAMPADVANAIAFLLSDQAAAITGTTLLVDAGVTAALLWNCFGGPDFMDRAK